jgi:hypothetical protein
MQIKICKMLKIINILCNFQVHTIAYRSIPQHTGGCHNIPQHTGGCRSKQKQTVSRWQALAPPKKPHNSNQAQNNVTK